MNKRKKKDIKRKQKRRKAIKNYEEETQKENDKEK